MPVPRPRGPQEGYRADLLLVAGNPLEDSGVLAQPERHLRLVIKGGAVAVDARQAAA